MGLQIQIWPILRVFLVDFGKVLCSSANELQHNSNASSRGDYIPQILAVLFEILRVYIPGLHLTFVAFCLLSFIRKQKLKQCNYSVDQSALLTRFRTDFTSSVWNFCRWVADVPPRKTSAAAKSEEKRMFSQAIEGLMNLIYFIISYSCIVDNVKVFLIISISLEISKIQYIRNR